MNAELEARRTAAAAVLGDYRQAASAWLDMGERTEPDWHTWALRLAHALGQLLEAPAGPAAPDQAPVTWSDAARLAGIRAVLDVFDWETDDRQYALERIEEIVLGEDVTR